MTEHDDHRAIADTLQRYCLAIDDYDFERMHSVFTPDAWSQYSTHPPFEGAQALIDFLRSRTSGVTWQQHFAAPMHISIDGDRATAVTYFIAHLVGVDGPGSVSVNVGDYRDTLVRTLDGWRINKRVQKTGWKELRRNEVPR